MTIQILKNNTIKLALKGSILLFSRLSNRQKQKILNTLYKFYHFIIRKHPGNKQHKIINMLSHKIGLFFTTLSYEEKRKITEALNPEQKRFAEKFLAERRLTYFRIRILKKHLYDLGLSRRALSDLWKTYEQISDPGQKLLVAWELALWYANQDGPEGADECLKLLSGILEDDKLPDKVRRAAVLAAECHEVKGDTAAGQHVIQHALRFGPDIDLFLAAANLETDIAKRVQWINKGLRMKGLSDIAYTPTPDLSAYDCMKSSCDKHYATHIPDNSQKVSVIVPAYNAQSTISTTIESLLLQTWTNIEIMVVDDCSKDDTIAVVNEYCKKDPRVRLLSTKTNSGPYVARNIALKQASGDFVTCNDADDWAHPEKIEKQVLHLIKNSSVIGNTSQQARTTSDLKIYRRGNPGFYIFDNMSSLLFRRIPVLTAVGYWDCVRFAGDSEFIWRIRKVLGQKAIVSLKTGPLAFPRQAPGSLTGDSSFGYNGYFMGARKEYFDYFTYFHATAQNLRYEFPQKRRPFPVPEPLWPEPEAKPNGRRHFDVILISDFRLQDNTTMSNIKEINAQKEMGWRTGLFQMPCYGFDPNHPINPEIRDLVDGEKIQIIVYGEKLSCNLLVLTPPHILQERQRFIPDVQATSVCVIISQTAESEDKAESTMEYDIHQCIFHLQKYFGKTGTWYPASPLIREALQQQVGDLAEIPLANKDWTSIAHINDWSCPSRAL